MLELELEPREALYIFQLTDWHVGSKHCNLPYIRYMIKQMRELKGPKLINITGDIFETASKHVGNSSFKQVLSLNQQKKVVFKLLSPLMARDDVYPGFALPGNHEARLRNEFDFNFMEDFIDIFNFEYHNYTDKEMELNDEGKFVVSPDYVLKVIINGKPLKIYGKHGNGSSKRLDLAMGKIWRETVDISADIFMMGHLHRCHNFPTFVKTSKDEGGMKRRHYAFGGHFLRYNKSYAHDQALDILPEAFNRIEVVDAHEKLHIGGKVHYIDRYRPDLFKI